MVVLCFHNWHKVGIWGNSCLPSFPMHEFWQGKGLHDTCKGQGRFKAGMRTCLLTSPRGDICGAPSWRVSWVLKRSQKFKKRPDPNMSLLGFSNSDHSDYPLMGCPSLYSSGYKYSKSSGIYLSDEVVGEWENLTLPLFLMILVLFSLGVWLCLVVFHI